MTGAPEVLDEGFDDADVANNDKMSKEEPVDTNEELYSRSVETNDKTRLKNLKRLILQDMNLQDTCAIRLYKNQDPLLGEMELVKDLMLERVEVELYYEIHI